MQNVLMRTHIKIRTQVWSNNHDIGSQFIFQINAQVAESAIDSMLYYKFFY